MITINIINHYQTSEQKAWELINMALNGMTSTDLIEYKKRIENILLENLPHDVQYKLNIILKTIPVLQNELNRCRCNY